ncbi:MAG: ABC transporter permease [Chloroflexi bacterium]|nr:ABC transporter permease [Chloroflexota bacterium]
MSKFLVRRIIFLIITLFIVSIIVFAISEIAPGNIAINTLGNTITPEQEASFNAQNGLDQPPVERYLRWMIGSDWQAARLIGRPVERVYDPDNQRLSWWIVGEDGARYQNSTPDGETMYRLVRQPDGTTKEEVMGGDVWKPNEDGLMVYWGIDPGGRAAMWVRGDDLMEWTLTKATWTSIAGAPRSYLPLQKGLLRGDPGVSFQSRRPVAETLIVRVKNTAFLAGLAFVIVMPISLVLGLIAGLNEGKFIDRVLSISSLIFTATPEFTSGVFLILIFSTWLGWFPGAVVATTDTAIFEDPKMLVLPVMTLTLVELGYVLRITRASMVEVMRTNYIRTAVLKGLPRFRIVFKHALRNALMAPITVIILHVNWLVGGIVIVEAIFGFPGLGRYVMEAALFKDVFAVEAAAMLLVLIAVGTQMAADFIYTFINPRIRYA